MSVGIGTGIYAAPTDENCNFSIPNVPDGNYQLVFWDNNLDLIFAFTGITIVGGECTHRALPAATSARCRSSSGSTARSTASSTTSTPTACGTTTRDRPRLETGFNLRWRDGTIYQGNVSDGVGAFTFDQVFPFFSWLVAEVDFVRNQATGVTVVVDNGGAIPGLGLRSGAARRQRHHLRSDDQPAGPDQPARSGVLPIRPSAPRTPTTGSISARCSPTASRASSARPTPSCGASATTRTARTAASRASSSTRSPAPRTTPSWPRPRPGSRAFRA